MTFASRPVPDGWESEWMRFHRPVEVGSLWIGPPWEEPTPGLVPVVIDPGLAFGTGAHPTTQLCLELIQSLERSSLLDIGSGSGVLAIARVQARLRARRGDLTSTRLRSRPRGDNAEANGVPVEAALLDAAGARTLPDAQIAVANIDLSTVSELVLPEPCHARDLGVLRDRPAGRSPGSRIVDRLVKERWAADLFTRE